MKLLAKLNRELVMINAQNSQNENDVEKIIIQVPEQFEDFNKKIVFVTPDGIIWDTIINNEYLLKKAVTKFEKVDFYLWLTKENQDFRTVSKTLNFYKNEDASEEITPEEISGVLTYINYLDAELLKLDTRISSIEEFITTINLANEEAERIIAEFDNHVDDVETELNTIADGVRDLATAIQFATFEIDENMNLIINQADKLVNTNFYINNNGELEVEVA